MKLVISLIGMNDRANEIFRIAEKNGDSIGEEFVYIANDDKKEAFLCEILGNNEKPLLIDYDGDGYEAINDILVHKDPSAGISTLSMSIDEVYNGSFDMFVEQELYVYYDSQIRTDVVDGNYLSLKNHDDKVDFLYAWLGVDIDVPRGQKHHLVEFIDEIKIYEKKGETNGRA